MREVGRRAIAWAWVPTLLFAAALVALSAVPVVILAVADGWDGVYGQDAYHYHGYAVGELRAALLAGRAPAPFTWPPGYPTLVALMSLATGPVTAAGQLVSLAAGAIVPVATWALARELRPWTGSPSWVAPLAGVLMACVPHLWQSSAVVMSDTTGLAAITVGAWALVRWAAGGTMRWAVLAAVAVAFGVDTRQVDVLAGLPLALAGVVVGVRRSRVPGSPSAAVIIGLPLLAAVLVLAPMIGPMAWSAARGEAVPFAIQLVSHPWDPGNLVRTEIASRDGLGRWALPMGLFYLTEPGRSYHLGPFFALLAVGGAVTALRRPRLVPVAVLIGWPLAVMAFLAGDVVQNTRFTLAALPPVAILAAEALGVVARWAARRPGRRATVTTGLTGVLVALAIGVNLVGAWRFTHGFIERFEGDRAAIARLAARVPANDRLIAFGATLALRFLGRDAVELYDLTPEAAVALATEGPTTWLLVPAGDLGIRWADASPGRALAALQDRPGLVAITTDATWQLWRASDVPP